MNSWIETMRPDRRCRRSSVVLSDSRVEIVVCRNRLPALQHALDSAKDHTLRIPLPKPLRAAIERRRRHSPRAEGQTDAHRQRLELASKFLINRRASVCSALFLYLPLLLLLGPFHATGV